MAEGSAKAKSLWGPQAPDGAPNIVVVMLDDVGFGASSVFGGPVATPTLEALAGEGLRYNRFHTTAICSPSRAALLTGRNAHATGIGSVMDTADSRPGYCGVHGKDTATVAEILRQNGYSTAAFGKWHQTPPWESSQSGPFDRWPTGEGFEKFYGFLGGETDQFYPTLYEGTTPVLRPEGDDYHLTADLVDHAIDWLRARQSVTPAKPFFLYLPTGAIHAPIQVPPEYIERYRGRFAQGWDELREEIFARQKAQGVVPADTILTPRHESLPGWDTLSADQKKFASRLMEAYAGFLAHTDEEIGRLVAELKDSGRFDNTLFIYIVGDNGASAEGGIYGSLNYFGSLQGLPEPEEQKLAGIDTIGTADSYAHINSGWAWAMSTPFKWTKTVASHFGGTRNGMVLTWPKKVTDKGGIRHQFSHLNDIAPTILEAAGIAAPNTVNGVAQQPMHGTSLVYSFAPGVVEERHKTQYFEVFGHRAIYHDGWIASAFHSRLPWELGFQHRPKPFEEDTWELYDLGRDFSQADDLADQHPDRLEELKALFLKEAKANKVLPLVNLQIGAGLPDLAEGVIEARYRNGTIGVPEKAVPHMFNRSWELCASLHVTGETRGVVATIGGTSAGWALYIDADRRPVFTYRDFAVKTVHLRGEPLPAGDAKLRLAFAYAGADGSYGAGADLTLCVNGAAVARDSLPATPPAMFSIVETFDVGVDTGSPAGDYPPGSPIGYRFEGGQIYEVIIRLA